MCVFSSSPGQELFNHIIFKKIRQKLKNKRALLSKGTIAKHRERKGLNGPEPKRRREKVSTEQWSNSVEGLNSEGSLGVGGWELWIRDAFGEGNWGNWKYDRKKLSNEKWDDWLKLGKAEMPEASTMKTAGWHQMVTPCGVEWPNSDALRSWMDLLAAALVRSIFGCTDRPSGFSLLVFS